MNILLANHAREKIQEGLLKLTEAHRTKFKRIYSQDNMELSIIEIIRKMPEDKLDHALTIVNRTLEINKSLKVEEEA